MERRNMNGTLIRYKASPERAGENQELIEKVFAELRAKSPEEVRYMVLRLDDGTFLHFVVATPERSSAITGLEAFRTFQQGIKERCVEPPQRSGATVVGNYAMLSE